MLYFDQCLVSLQVFLFQKSAAYRCNTAGKPLIITRVVDSMASNLRPTRAEATDVANAVLDGQCPLHASGYRLNIISVLIHFFSTLGAFSGADGILLGGETFGGLYPVEAIKTVRKICAEASQYNSLILFPWFREKRELG